MILLVMGVFVLEWYGMWSSLINLLKNKVVWCYYCNKFFECLIKNVCIYKKLINNCFLY